MENEHWPCTLTNDEVTLPVAALGSGLDMLGPFVDGDATLDGILRRSRSARAAAFALLGMVNWIYQWYKPEGDLQAQTIVPQFTELIFGGIFS